MNKDTIELPIEFIDSLVEYLESCTRESALAARGIRRVAERYRKRSFDLEEPVEEAPAPQEQKDNVLSFPDST